MASLSVPLAGVIDDILHGYDMSPQQRLVLLNMRDLDLKFVLRQRQGTELVLTIAPNPQLDRLIRLLESQPAPQRVF